MDELARTASSNEAGQALEEQEKVLLDALDEEGGERVDKILATFTFISRRPKVNLVTKSTSLFLRLIEDLEEGNLTLPKKTINLLLSEFACAFSPIILFLFNSKEEPMNEIWNLLVRIRDVIGQKFDFKDKSGLVMRYARILQLFTVLFSKRPEDIEPVEGEDAELSKGSWLKGAQVREEGIKSLDRLIGLLWLKPPFASLLAIVNLLGRIARTRPIFLSKITPALIDLLEAGTLDLVDKQRMHLEHTLKKQLEGLIENVAAEKYLPLIVEALKKSRNVESKKRRVEEDEDDITLSKVGTKKLKTAADVKVETVPLHIASEVVLVTLLRTRIEQFKTALEAWRPSASPSVASPSTRSATVRDPRLAEAKQQEEDQSASLAIDGVKADQSVPFVFQSRFIEATEMVALIKQQIYRLFIETSSLVTKTDLRKTKLRSIVRLGTYLTKESQGKAFTDALMQFVFEQDINERISLLLYWLRLTWLQSTITTSDMENNYEHAYSIALIEVENMVTEGLVQWELCLQKFFSKVPQLVGTAHLILLSEICRNAATRIPGLALIEYLIIDRPSCSDDLLGVLLEMCREEDDILRKASIMVIDRLLKVSRLVDTIIKASQEALVLLSTGESDSSLLIDLPLHVALRTLLIEQFCESYEKFPSDLQQYCLQQAPMLPVDATVGKNIANYSIDPLQALGKFLEKLVESICKNVSLNNNNEEEKEKEKEGDIIELFLNNIKAERWPARLLDRMIIYADLDHAEPALVKFINSVDPGDENERPNILSLLTKMSDKFTSSNVLYLLHFIDVPVKRSVEYIQMMLTLMKPDAFANAIQSLVGAEELPLMLMRTLIQALTLNRNMTGLIVGQLTRLIGREIWNNARLWDGFVRCIKTLGRSAYAAMLQLPTEQLEKVLASIPEMRDEFTAYLKQQSTTIQGKYASILGK